MSEARKILVLGASGLIGRFVTDNLRARGFHVVGIARRFPPSQKASALDLELPVMSMDPASLAPVIGEHGIELVVNCLGVLQDGPGSDTGAVHRDFVARLLQAIGDSGRAIRLVHISIPGAAAIFQAVSPLVYVRHSRFRLSHDHSLADDRQADLMGMIPKSGNRFSEKIMPHQRVHL